MEGSHEVNRTWINAITGKNIKLVPRFQLLEWTQDMYIGLLNQPLLQKKLVDLILSEVEYVYFLSRTINAK